MTERSLTKLEPSFRTKVELFLKEVGDKVFVTESFRSAERQKKLYSQKLSHLDGVNKKSLHQTGRAVDIAFIVYKYGSLYPRDMKLWEEVANAAARVGIDWGYDLWKWDKPHFQDNFKPLIKQSMPEFDADKTAQEWGTEATDALKWYRGHEISSVQSIDDLRDAIKFYRFSRR